MIVLSLLLALTQLKAKPVLSTSIIPADYDKRTAPPLVDGKPNEIKVTMDIFSIPNFDEKEEEIMLEVRVTHIWTDTRLNTSHLTEIAELDPSSIKEFWVPDSYFHHAKEAEFIELMTPTASLRIRHDQALRYSTM